MKPKRMGVVLAVGVLLAGGVLWSQRQAPGCTRIALTDGATGKPVAVAFLRDGESVVLKWRNSQFDIDVTEGFHVDGGRLIQDTVTFADPRGLPAPEVTARDLEDLYHTGGPFSAHGLNRPFARVVYRVSEKGNPRMHLGGRVVGFKQAVGFGGSVVLTASRPAWFHCLFQVPCSPLSTAHRARVPQPHSPGGVVDDQVGPLQDAGGHDGENVSGHRVLGGGQLR